MSSHKGNRTEQLNLRLHSDTVEKLDSAALEFKLRGRNSVAQDIIETYYEAWVELQEMKQQAVTQQRKNAAASFGLPKSSENEQGFRNARPVPTEKNLPALSEQMTERRRKRE